MNKMNTWDIIGWTGMGLFAIAALLTLNYLWILPGVLVKFIFVVIDLWQQPSTYINGDRTSGRKRMSDEEEHWIYYNLFDKKK